MSRRKGRWAAALAALLLAGGFLLSQRPRPPRAPRAEAGPVAPRREAMAESRRIEVPVFVECVGTVRSLHEAAVSARIVAEVREVLKRPGEAVQRGETLAALDSRDLEARVEQAGAALRSREEGLTEARTHLERTRNLFAKEAATKQELDIAGTRFAAAAAQREEAAKALDEARVRLGHATITAPFDGLVHERLAEPGDLATPGKALLGLHDPSRLRLEAIVEERLLPKLKLGDRLEVVIEAAGRRLEGEVREILPVVDPLARTGTVKIDLPSSGDVRPGMFGRALVPAGRREAIVVPRSALLRRGQLEMVFAAAGSGGGAPPRAALRIVRSGGTIRGSEPEEPLVEILSGLEAGEQVLAAASADLREGMPIEPVRDAAPRPGAKGGPR